MSEITLRSSLAVATAGMWLCFCAACERNANGQIPMFYGIPRPNDSSAMYATGLSTDGAVVALDRRLNGGGGRASYWSLATGVVAIDELAPEMSYARDISGDGQVIVGTTSTFVGGESFRWSKELGMQLLDPGRRSNAYAASQDGQTIAGSARVGVRLEAFVWTETTGLVTLGGFPGDPDPSTQAVAISAAGDVVGGWDQQRDEGFYWTATTGMIGIGDLAGGDFYSLINGMSGDGSVLVGTSRDKDSSQAIKWTPQAGIQALTSGPPFSRAFDASYDGSVIGGTSGSKAVIWERGAMRRVEDILTNDFGIDLAGWDLRSVTGLSDDGKVLAGDALDPTGSWSGWIAVVPEPSSFSHIVMLGLCLSGRRLLTTRSASRFCQQAARRRGDGWHVL